MAAVKDYGTPKATALGGLPGVIPLPGMKAPQGIQGPADGPPNAYPNPTGLNSPAHTGAGIGDVSGYQGVINQAVTPGGPNPLADFHNSALGQAVDHLYGPTQMPNYQGAFQSALNAARGNIHQQLGTALSDIQNSQARAGEALGNYAPMVNGDYKEGMGGAAQAAHTIDQAMVGQGFNPLGAKAADAYLAPDRAAVAGTHREDLADQALLKTGIGQQAEHESALANLAAQDRYGQLDQQQAQLAAQMQMAAMQNQNAMEMAKYGQEARGVNAIQDFGLQQQLNAGAQTKNTNPATGPYAPFGLTQGQVSGAQAEPKYSRWSQLINSVRNGKTDKADPKILGPMIKDALAGDTQLFNVLQAENPAFFTTYVK